MQPLLARTSAVLLHASTHLSHKTFAFSSLVLRPNEAGVLPGLPRNLSPSGAVNGTLRRGARSGDQGHHRGQYRAPVAAERKWLHRSSRCCTRRDRKRYSCAFNAVYELINGCKKCDNKKWRYSVVFKLIVFGAKVVREGVFVEGVMSVPLCVCVL